MEHILSIICGKGESVTASIGAVGLDGIVKTAGFTNDRHGTVTGSDHLGKSARFALGGHKENIRARVNQFGKRTVIHEVDGRLAGITLCGSSEEILISLFARSEKNELNITLHDLVENRENEVEALMGSHSRNHCDHGNFGVNVKTESLLKCFFIFLFTREVIRAVSKGKIGILLGDIISQVDTVDDTADLSCILTENILQP